MSQALIGQLRATQEYFTRSSSCLTEADAGYAPTDGVYTVAQQVAHVAQTVDWFMDGGFKADGFDMDFEAHGKEIRKVTSLAAAREWVVRAFDAGANLLAEKSDEELHSPLPEGLVMGGLPRASIVGGIVDHTAHHRGVLTAYSRGLGKVPSNPYMDM